jgi:(S)-2-hydroxyglutarate dehydrogenase
VFAQAPAGAEAPARCDVAVIGGGILGVAVARELLHRRPRTSLCLLEREEDLAAHQSTHNSGVIHAGIYYAPGSLKARLCVQGARELYAYCERRGIPHERCGKLIVASAPREIEALRELARRGAANGVQGLRMIDAASIARIEPHARGLAALHSPETGIVDFAAVTRALASDCLEAGATVTTGCELTGIDAGRQSLRLRHSRGSTEASNAVFCAGAWSDRLAVMAGADPDPRIVPFRGAYLRVVPSSRELVRSLIYPVPDPALPFLGVHLSRHIGGELLIGPTALPVGARDAYRLSTVRTRDLLETLSWPGTWRMFARWSSAGLTELRHAARRSALVAAAARFVPELRAEDVQPAFAGVRAQALGRDGRLLDDFAFSHTERAVHVRNAPSPAATSSLAIARHVADVAERAFGPGRA